MSHIAKSQWKGAIATESCTHVRHNSTAKQMWWQKQIPDCQSQMPHSWCILHDASSVMPPPRCLLLDWCSVPVSQLNSYFGSDAWVIFTHCVKRVCVPRFWEGFSLRVEAHEFEIWPFHPCEPILQHVWPRSWADHKCATHANFTCRYLWNLRGLSKMKPSKCEINGACRNLW